MNIKNINLATATQNRNRAAARTAPMSIQCVHQPKARSAEIRIYGEIGFWEVEAANVAREIEALDVDEITVRINSPGGDVFDGIAIMNLLRNHKAKVTTVVDGLAASIASVIMLAGDEVEVSPSSMVMIHQAWFVAVGNKKDLRDAADLLGQIEDATIIPAYVAKTGKSKDEIVAMLEAAPDGTWLSAEQAIENGFADRMTGVNDEVESMDAAAGWNFAALGFRNVPDELTNRQREAAEAKGKAKAEAEARIKNLRRRLQLEESAA